MPKGFLYSFDVVACHQSCNCVAVAYMRIFADENLISSTLFGYNFEVFVNRYSRKEPPKLVGKHQVFDAVNSLPKLRRRSLLNYLPAPLFLQRRHNKRSGDDGTSLAVLRAC